MAEWTDYWGDWSSAEALNLAPLKNILQALIDSYNQRACPVFPIYLNYDGGAYNDSIHLRPILNAFFIIHYRLLNLCYDHYINHLDNGGNWHGVDHADFAPRWNATSLAAAIGQPSILEPLAINSLQSLAHLAYQYYKIINKMKWVGQYGQSRNVVDTRTSFVKLVDSHVSWPDCENNFSLAPWIPYSITYNVYYEADYANSPPTYWTLQGRKTNCNMTWSGAELAQYPYSVDAYVYSWTISNPYEGQHYPIDSTQYYQKWNRVKQVATSATHNFDIWDDADYVGNTHPPLYGWLTRHCAYVAPFWGCGYKPPLILKFDDSFTFKDW